MRFLGHACLWLAALQAAWGAEWISISSPNFHLYTAADGTAGREALEIFERARAFFTQVNLVPITEQVPLTLVAFNDSRDFRPYAPKDLALAYFSPGEDRDYIVIADLSVQRSRVAIHEYVHLLVRHSGLSVPLWLDEGMAEVYSMMESREGRILLGGIPRDRASTLGGSNWMRLSALAGVSAASPEYNDPARAPVFYAQSCLLAHMLMLDDAYSGKFGAFIRRLSESGSAQTAFSDVYGKSLAAVEREMNEYFRRTTIGGSTRQFDYRTAAITTARPATELEIDLVLAKVLLTLGRVEEAAARLTALTVANRGDATVEEALAYLDWRRGNREAALQHFQSALAQGISGWKPQWDYARLLSDAAADRAALVTALRRTLDLKPDLAQARLMLGRERFAARDYEAALAELQQVKTIDSDHAAAVYLMQAYAALELKQVDEARRYAEEARKYPRSSDQNAALEALSEALRHTGNRPVEAAPAGDSEFDGGPPVLRRRAPDASQTPPRK